MITPKVLNLILALQVLTTMIMYVNALPITSKPIENTAENLAWQAWLMLPPEQKNLEKSRKVTPKSIFTLPNRECPPNHHLIENNCIPTVEIDQEELLTQELLGILDGLAGGGTNYEEFDYDDLGGEVETEVMYESPQKLSGDESNNDTYDQLPNKDEPLKFNIFQQKFPTDYESMATPSEEAEQQQTTAAKSNNSTIKPLAEAVNALAITEPMQNASNSNADLQMESSNVSTNIVENTATITATAAGIVTPTTTFSISDIDAIVLPATIHSFTVEDVNLENKKQNVQKLSLFKDDSSVQLITTSLLKENHDNENNKQLEFTQLLKADDLLSLPNVAARTSTKKGNFDNEVPTLSTSLRSSTTSSGISSNSATPLGSNSFNDEVTDMMLSDVEATMPSTVLSDLPKTIKQQLENSNKAEENENKRKKLEHPRSVLANLTETEAQELNFITTTEADATTNFQLDETTIEEVHDGTSIALKELLELSATQFNDNLSVVKKSKVDLVELPASTISTTSENVSASLTQPTTMLMTPTMTPLLKTATNIKTTDRFDNNKKAQKATKTGEDYTNDIEKLNFRNTETTTSDEIKKITETTTATTKTATTATTTTAKTSEIDIEQELRMINELVKGNNSSDINKAKVSKSTTAEAESGITTTTISALTTNQVQIVSEEESSSSTATSINPATDASTTTEELSTSTIWSKIMPLLGISSGSTVSIETTNSESTTPTSHATNSKSQLSDGIISSLKNNRNNRNSKIIRINSLSLFSNSKNSKTHITNSDSSKKATDKLYISSTQNPLIASTTTSTTTEAPTSTTTTISTTTEILDSSDDDSNNNTPVSNASEPFWWLPIGWRLDGSNEPSLLLSFWSALPSQRV